MEAGEEGEEEGEEEEEEEETGRNDDADARLSLQFSELLPLNIFPVCAAHGYKEREIVTAFFFSQCTVHLSLLLSSSNISQHFVLLSLTLSFIHLPCSRSPDKYLQVITNSLVCRRFERT